MPVGVFKLCPDKTHVIERKLGHCPYCAEDGASKGRAKRNQVNPMARLKEDATVSPPTAAPPPLPRPPAQSKLASTRIVDSKAGGREGEPEAAPPPPFVETHAPSTDQLGPSAAASDPFQTKPYGTPIEPGPPRQGDQLEKTMPLAAAGIAASPGPGGAHSSTQVLLNANQGGTAPPQHSIAPVVGWLRALNGSRGGASWEVREDRNLIGADPNCPIQLAGVTVQPRHASLMGHSGTFMLTRTDTQGELRVNGKAVDQVRLYDGDLVHIGDIALRFRCLTTEDLEEIPRGGEEQPR